ncbi:hypothetical protein ACOSP7_019635 [Xanthoceras sorbifolium]
MRGRGGRALVSVVWPSHSRRPSFINNSISTVHNRHRHSYPTVVGTQRSKCQSLEEHYQRKPPSTGASGRHPQAPPKQVLQGHALLGERLGILLIR